MGFNSIAVTVFLCLVQSEITAPNSTGGILSLASQMECTAEQFGALAWLPTRAGLCRPLSGPCSTVGTEVFPAARVKKQDYCTYGWSWWGSAPPLLVSCLISWHGKDGLDRTRKQEGEGRLIYPLALLFLLPCDLVKQGDDVSFEVQSIPHPSPQSVLAPPPPKSQSSCFLLSATEGWGAGAVLNRGLRARAEKQDFRPGFSKHPHSHVPIQTVLKYWGAA